MNGWMVLFLGALIGANLVYADIAWRAGATGRAALSVVAALSLFAVYASSPA